MFKHILPQEAQVNSRHTPYFDNHLQSSAFKPLATAIFTVATKLKSAVSKYTRKKNGF